MWPGFFVRFLFAGVFNLPAKHVAMFLTSMAAAEQRMRGHLEASWLAGPESPESRLWARWATPGSVLGASDAPGAARGFSEPRSAAEEACSEL